MSQYIKEQKSHYLELHKQGLSLRAIHEKIMLIVIPFFGGSCNVILMMSKDLRPMKKHCNISLFHSN